MQYLSPVTASSARFAGVILASVLTLSCSFVGTGRADKSPSLDSQSCGIKQNLVPTCGAWWGVSPGSSSLSGLEGQVGRRFDIVYEWSGIDQRLPTHRQEENARGGRYLHINIESRRFTEPGHSVVDWSDVASGRFDNALRTQADGLRRLGEPVFVTFDHEADRPDKVGVRGGAADFIAAWRHIVNIYRARGATNVIWVWVVTGWEDNFGRAAKVYPGDDYVDWISWEGYNAAGCREGSVDTARYQSFAEAIEPFHSWLRTEGRHHGIDPSKPYMISEMGSVLFRDDPSLTARWYDELVSQAKRFPGVRAVKLWNSATSRACDYRVGVYDQVVDAYRRAGQNPYFNPRR